LVLVDDFSVEKKKRNTENKTFIEKVDRKKFIEWLTINQPEMVIHLGARTDTTEFDTELLYKLNLKYTKDVWQVCTNKNIPFIYASSAATYGDGNLGYSDIDNQLPFQLAPLNPYGISKNDFDKIALTQNETPPFWAGLKFFNVYGPNEYHKERMASVIFHSFNQIKKTGKSKLFKSHRTDFENGKQLRDFIYVKDVASVIVWLMQNKTQSGLYNLGTGQARSFLDLATAVFSSLNIDPNIEFIDIPEDIRDKYQYFTEADMSKLKNAGYNAEFTSLEDGISDYVKNYLSHNLIY
jgi:ADP-L-glycero-D-manno-heptose 6-epimerase